MHLETAPPQLQELIERAEYMPMGDEELQVVRSAMNLAEELTLDGWAYKLRLWHNRSAFRMGDTDALLTSFTRSLAIHDSDPERFPLEVDEDTHLLFQYKWVAEMLNESPAYSLGQIQGIYADMERRFQEAGASPSGYLQTRFGGATDRGEWAEAEEIFTQLQAAPRDDLSHCEACYRSTAAMYHRDKGQPERALELFEEIFSGHLTCGDEPEYSEAQAMFLHLRAGNLDAARALHHKSLTAVRVNPDPGSMLLRHIEFCVITGNTPRALSLLEQFPRVFDVSPLSVTRQFDCLTTLAVLSNAMTSEGQGQLPIRGTNAPYFATLLGSEVTGDRTPRDIEDTAWARARAIADSFNTRNGNTHYTALYESKQNLLAERYDLPLGIEEYETPVDNAPVAQPTTVLDYVAAVRNTMLTNPQEAVNLYQAGLALPADDNTPELVLAVLHAPDGVLPDTAPTFDALVATLGETGLPALAATMSEYGPRFLKDLTNEDAPALTAKAAELAPQHPVDAAYLYLELSDLTAPTNPEQALTYATQAQTLMRGQAGQYKTALMVAGTALSLGNVEDASAALDTADALAHGSARLETHATFLRASIATQQENWDTALSLFDQAAHQALSSADHAVAWQLFARKASVHASLGMLPDAARAMRRAVRYATTADIDEQRRMNLTYTLGRYLLDAGLPHDALANLTESLDWQFENDGEPELILEHLQAVGEAGYASGDYQQAFSAWVYALGYAEDNKQPDREFTIALRLTDFLTEVGHEEAVDYAERAWNLATTQEQPLAQAEAAKRVAIAQVVVAQTTDLSALERGEEALNADGVDPQDRAIALIELRMHRARLLWRMDHNEEAAAAATTVAGMARDIDLTPALADALTIAGLAHRDAGNTTQARENLEAARDCYEEGMDQIEFLNGQIEALGGGAE
ncbi:hypothetical protein [Jonesia quinghaiensis]|uniref:hypothetical protein n=1 Tax=Jonesia quinghaiensis TaxID=262806 RepID=UPI0004021603|nr:hypothetical protein [Jonesia quinghaiensis]